MRPPKKGEYMMMTAQNILAKLEAYEDSAYEGGIGVDWLAEIGEGFKYYVRECIENDVPVSMQGFYKKIDQMASERGL